MTYDGYLAFGGTLGVWLIVIFYAYFLSVAVPFMLVNSAMRTTVKTSVENLFMLMVSDLLGDLSVRSKAARGTLQVAVSTARSIESLSAGARHISAKISGLLIALCTVHVMVRSADPSSSITESLSSSGKIKQLLKTGSARSVVKRSACTLTMIMSPRRDAGFSAVSAIEGSEPSSINLNDSAMRLPIWNKEGSGYDL